MKFALKFRKNGSILHLESSEAKEAETRKQDNENWEPNKDD